MLSKDLKQGEFQAYGAVICGISEAPHELVCQCRNYMDAVKLCIRLLAGNRAISQFFAAQSHGLLNSQNRTAEIAEMKHRLAVLEGAAG